MWEYENATVDWYAPEMVEQTDRNLEAHFLHEMVHIFLEELCQAHASDRQKHLERVCTRLGWALLWTDETAGKLVKRRSCGKKVGNGSKAEVVV